MRDEIVKVTIEAIVSGGAGLARIEGKSVFVEGTAPGETVICRLAEDRRSWARGELLEVERASPQRASPACPHYLRCGGCNLQHLSHQAQLAAKAGILKDAFARIAGSGAVEPAVFAGDPWEYRNRMQFHAVRRITKSRPETLFGLKARGADEIVPISDCPAADPGIRRVLQGDPEEAARLFVSPAKDRVAVYARDGIFLSEAARTRGTTRVLGRELALDAGVFFQSNGAMLERLIRDLRDIAAGLDGEARRLPLADLYCGVGVFAALLADLFPRADLVEENKAALALARENLRAVPGARFFAKRAGDWAKNAGLGAYGLIVVDPPRGGLEGALAQRFADTGPRAVAYVSCDPASLARDAKALLGAYDLADLRVYDFYPQTSQVESLAIFLRK